MKRRQFLKAVGATVAIGTTGTATACKHKHGKKRNRRHNTAPNTTIVGDRWGVISQSFGMTEWAITGELNWNGGFPADIFITATFYYKHGRVLSSDGIDNIKLAPGQTDGFQIDYLNGNGKAVNSYRLATEMF
ncbi:FxLYD domain-containing protein [Haladaptatus sp. DFWS20]|uniref:FxLYD domain-containing protein n=1 Tax=Haladaptatus sp. DFWS20 TaxID=3403467 RepID=UPI003EBAEB6C